ncbi:hypothetical protein D477_012485 [Arthrobacter crystallopoietes BAB-32]|uniref:DUF3040 domain-containing protein n=2 Tax=Crystallibacter crystallopoietes TaxID=37928 RepID=N1UU03_9MICC|nr:hypothetical protein D477_012485 [Arthrobacter crystallopoietes BAB-32]
MPLTHEERQQLEQLEHQASLDDPAFAEKMRDGLAGPSSVAGPWSLVLLLAGILVLLAGVAVQSIVVGIAGFLLMGAGTYLISDAPKSTKEFSWWK